MSENTPEVPVSEGNVAPTAPQVSTQPAPIPPSTSEEVEGPPEAPEGPTEAESAVPVNIDNGPISPTEPILDNGNKGENGINEEIQTAQTPPIEPLNKPDVTIEKTSDRVTITEVMQPTAHSARNEPLVKPSISSVVGNTAKQERVKKKLEKIIEVLNMKEKITNDEVEKLSHVSDSTATRYLEQLEKQRRIKQSGRTGKGVSYSKM